MRVCTLDAAYTAGSCRSRVYESRVADFLPDVLKEVERAVEAVSVFFLSFFLFAFRNACTSLVFSLRAWGKGPRTLSFDELAGIDAGSTDEGLESKVLARSARSFCWPAASGIVQDSGDTVPLTRDKLRSWRTCQLAVQSTDRESPSIA